MERSPSYVDESSSATGSPLQRSAEKFYRQVERARDIARNLERYRSIVASRDSEGRPVGIGFAVDALRLVSQPHRRIRGLDFGCGAGVLVAEIARTRDWDMYGFDADKALLAAARACFPIVADRLLAWDALEAPLPFPAGQFDFVFCNSVIQHFCSAELTTALTEIARVTTPKGLLVLTFKELLPTVGAEFADVDSALDPPPGRLLRLYTAEAVQQAAAASGLRPHESGLAPFRYRTKDGFHHVTALFQKAI